MQLLFPKEEEIMYAIWDIGHPCVISEIMRKHPELKRNTVAKVLTILEKKGYLRVDSIVKTVTRTGRAYAPSVCRDDYEAQQALMADIVKSANVQDGILSYCTTLLDSKKVSEKFVLEMEKLINDFKAKEN